MTPDAVLDTCCGGVGHKECGQCIENGHHYGKWNSHPAWAFEERGCKCCGHYESRPLPVGEEEW
ncbi:hypothetical protein LCGC14_1494030 [marine sediment metagenome]|uniref:Uncharacterized protein n=1 Tax=marine sediment metagenome TaxID=412755 RepID=A0A0F9LLF8_9ZZZZ